MRLTRVAALSVAVAAVMAALPSNGSAQEGPAPEGGGTSPGRPTVTIADTPDPFVLRVGGTFYAYATNRAAAFGGLVHVPVHTSTDLDVWTAVGDAFPDLAPWVRPGRTWAPSVLRDGDGYVLFYTAEERRSGRQCIGRARADAPTGPFVDRSRSPWICPRNQGGAIDPYYFRDRDGRRYLYWKNDGNCCGLEVALWGRRLTVEERLVGDPVRLLRMDRDWELPLVENPAMTRSPHAGGPYRLFYAANWWESRRYATGYARCDGPLGPCRKVTTNGPWLGTTDHAYGPGGASFFTDTGGRNWMVQHGWPRPPERVGYGAGGRRTLFVEKVDFGPTRLRVNLAYPYPFSTAAPHPFVDVPDGSHDAVAWALADGVTPGGGDRPDRRLRATAPVIRGDALAWLRTLLGPGGPALADLRQAGEPLTRGQAARLLYDAAGRPDVSGPAHDHPLTDVTPQLRAAVRFVIHDPDGDGPEPAITSGYRDLTYRPTVPVTRVAWLVMAHRLLTPA